MKTEYLDNRQANDAQDAARRAKERIGGLMDAARKEDIFRRQSKALGIDPDREEPSDARIDNIFSAPQWKGGLPK